MSKFKKLMVAGVAALGLVGTQATPASATSAAVGVFTGVASVGTGLSYPTSPTCAPSLCASGTGQTWSFSGSGVGAGAKVGTGASAGLFSTSVSGGTLTDGLLGGAWCGASGGKDGSGSAKVTAASPPLVDLETSVSNVGWVQSAGSLIVFTGTATEVAPGTTSSSTPGLVGVVTALPLPENLGPPPSGNSCLNGSAKTFTVVGAAAVIIP